MDQLLKDRRQPVYSPEGQAIRCRMWLRCHVMNTYHLERHPCHPFLNSKIFRFHRSTKIPHYRLVNEIRADSTIGRSQNVCDNVGVFIANSSTKSATVEQRSTEESDQHEREVATLVSDQKHIDELPVELLIDTFVYLSIEDLCAIRQTWKKWRQTAANCFQHNYSKLEVNYGRINIRLA